MAMPVGPPAGIRVAGILFAGILLGVGGLIFLGVYVALPQSAHIYALLLIGVLSLLFALGCYFSRALTPDPAIPRALSWGFAGLGFALLFLTIGLAPPSVLSFGTQLVALILVLIALAATVGGAWWMGRSQASDQRREAARREWASQPAPSALTYSTAQSSAGIAPPTATPPGGEHK